jgi:hypothetical protein
VDTWLPRNKALNGLGEERLAGENEYATDTH